MSLVLDTSRFESQRQSVQAKLSNGQPLDIYDAIFLAGYYPGVVKQLNPSPAPPLTPHERYEESMGRSYPSFEPQPPKQIVWPTETVTVGKSPTSAGRQVTIQRKPITESGPTLTGWLLERSDEAKIPEQFLPFAGMKTSRPSRVLETTAGVAANVESLVNPRTPFRISPSFIGGYVFGSLLLGYGIGKVMEPITSPYTNLISEKVSGLFRKAWHSDEMPSNYLDWDEELSLKEKLTPTRYQDVTKGYVDVPNAAAVTEGRSTVTREFLREPVPSNYLEGFMKGDIVKGEYVGEGLTRDIARPSNASLESFMKGEIIRGEYTGEGLTHGLKAPEGMGSLTGFKKGIDDIVFSAPDEYLKFLDKDFTLPPMRGLEAESAAMSFGTMPKTALLDPELVSPLENVITRQLYSLPPSILVSTGRSASILPSAIFGLGVSAAMLGLSASRSTPTLTPISRGIPKLGLPTRMDLGLTPDVASMLDLSPLTAQSSMTEQVAKTVQIQTPKQLLRTINEFPSELRQLPSPRFDRQTPFDFKHDFFKPTRRKKGAWEKGYIWEFPVKGAKYTRKLLL